MAIDSLTKRLRFISRLPYPSGSFDQYDRLQLLGLPVIEFVPSETGGVDKIRVVYKTGSTPYIEIHTLGRSNITVEIPENATVGWTALTPAAGSIPSGYSTKEVVLQ